MRLNIHKSGDSLPCALPSCDNVFLYDGTKAHRKYCSWKCAASAPRIKRRKKQIVSCDSCGKVFKRMPSKIHKAKYCARKCSAIGWSKKCYGAGNPRWKGGSIPYQWYGQTWRRQRRKALKRDNHRCQRCSITQKAYGKTLHVHHVIPYISFESSKKANYLKNLTTLCPSCHKIMEKSSLQYPRLMFLPLTF